MCLIFCNEIGLPVIGKAIQPISRRALLKAVWLLLTVGFALGFHLRAGAQDPMAIAADRIQQMGFPLKGKLIKDRNGVIVSVLLRRINNDQLESIDFQALSGLRSLSISSPYITNRGLKHLVQNIPARQLQHLLVNHASIDDEGLAPLLQVQSSLDSLVLTGTLANDRFLQKLYQLEDISSLDLSDTKISDGGLTYLATLQKLRHLALADTAVSNMGLPSLAKLQNLFSLDLSGTKVTDDGIQALATLPRLRILSIRNTRVTKAGRAVLKDALPTLKFEE